MKQLLSRAAGATYGWACERLYHEAAWSYDTVSALVSGGEWDRWRAAALAFVPGGRVLEVGFGTGALLAQMAQAGLSVTGLELSPQMQAQTGRRVARLGLEIARVQAAAQAMPFPAGHFAGVISTFPAPYILEAATLAEVERLLAPAGRLVIGGLWVRATGGMAARLPLLFGAPPQSMLDQIARRCAAAGLTARFHEEPFGLAAVGIVIAAREGDQ